MIRGDDIQGRQFEGYGRCIYCGADGATTKLHKEHIIPFALGGNTIIKNANCTECRKLTHEVDTHLARMVFGEFRIHAGVQTRNPEQRPAELQARIAVGGTERSYWLKVKDHPFSLALPVWGDATIIQGLPPSPKVPDVHFNFYNFSPANLPQNIGAPVGQEVRILTEKAAKINVAWFARGIAKIAYCHAVLQYGLDGLRWLAIRDVILGKYAAPAHFVGSPLVPPPPPNRDRRVGHLIGQHELTSLSGRLRLRLTSVRLFASAGTPLHGMPPYVVVVGASTRPDGTGVHNS
jgi:hypothetical protein